MDNQKPDPRITVGQLQEMMQEMIQDFRSNLEAARQRRIAQLKKDLVIYELRGRPRGQNPLVRRQAKGAHDE